MIITRTWLEEFINISNIDTDTLCQKLNSIGLEVDSVHTITLPKKVVVGYVLSKEKHPDADKLSICQVDIGDTTTQIVCGAKNVAAKQYVAVATVGAVLGENFKIKKAKLRGVESNGMICSSTELGLPQINDGIMVLDSSIGELVIGKQISEYPLLNDDIIEIELTANRGDCLSINGVARELCSAFNIPLNVFEPHIQYNDKGIGQILDIKCDSNIESDLIYKAVNIKNMQLPTLIELRAAFVDSLSKCTTQTAVNYAIHATGVLLTAYNKSLAVQSSKGFVHFDVKQDNNGVDTVYGKEVLSQIAIDSHQQKINEHDIIVEASYIDPQTLCQKVFDKGIKTGDIYYRSSRGSEPHLKYGIDYLSSLLSHFGANVYNGSEELTVERNKKQINVNTRKVHSIIGQTVGKAKIKNILKSLGFEIKDAGHENLSVEVPLYRHDIENIADITEEIVRIIGIDNIASKPLCIDETNRTNTTSKKILLKNHLRTMAVAEGFYETLTYLFTSRKTLESNGFEVIKSSKDLLNPITQELDTLRTTMIPNLVEACSKNFKNGFKSVRLFEIGTIFDSNAKETTVISFIFSGLTQSEALSNHGKPSTIDLFTFAQKISHIVGAFELETIQEVDNNFMHPYQCAKIVQNKKIIGTLCKLHPSISSLYDLPDTFYAQIDFDCIDNQLKIAQQYSVYQASKRDLSILAPKSLSYQKIKQSIKSLQIQEIKQFHLVDIYQDESLGENESLTIKFILQSQNATLLEDEINTIMQTILTKLQDDFQIGLRE